MSETKEIKELGTSTEAAKESGIQVLTIIGQIEGHYISDQNQKTTKYEHIVPLLVAMEQSEDVRGVLIVLNTMGGDVEAGLGISEMIASMTKPTVSLVIGGSHSIGVPLAVSAKHSFIVPSATMTIHPVRVNGLVVGAPQTYNYFADMQKRIVSFICRHSNATEQTINEMMMRPDMLATDVGTVLEGREAVACGLIDEIGGLSDALKKLNEMIK
jgi:ATP-dependent protease ClpP protease subunit